jgi:hypothetical protein
MSKYIVYCLNINNQLDIISIEEDEKVAKSIQNNHSFNLLCDLNKNKSLYKLEIKQNIIQIIEININIKNGWISNTITENKQSIYEIGIITYFKKDKLPLDINESYIPGNTKIEYQLNNSISLNIPSSVSTSGVLRVFNSNNINKKEKAVCNKKDKSNLNILLLDELKKKCKVID